MDFLDFKDFHWIFMDSGSLKSFASPFSPIEMTTIGDAKETSDRHSVHRSLTPSIVFGVLAGVLAGLLLVVVIVLSILYGIERSKTQPTVDNNEFCFTPSCINAANYLLESIDETVDPCDNFFEFACGAWIKKIRIPDSENSISTESQLRTQLHDIIDELLTSSPPNGTVELNSTLNARRMYASCINEEAIEAENISVILPFINTELGGWPILQGLGWDSSTFNLSRRLLKLTEYSNSVIFNAGTQIDQQNSSIRSVRISQNVLALGDRNYYFNESDVTRAYRQFMRDLALALANDTSMIEDDVNDIYTLEQTIARFVWTAAEQSAQSNKTIRTTISNLKSAINANVSISHIDYSFYFHSV
jgi:predicted metalloendopeptidase